MSEQSAKEPYSHEWELVVDGKIHTGIDDYPALELKPKAEAAVWILQRGRYRCRVDVPKGCQLIMLTRRTLIVDSKSGDTIGKMCAFLLGWKDLATGHKFVQMFQLNEKGEFFSGLLPTDGRND